MFSNSSEAKNIIDKNPVVELELLCDEDIPNGKRQKTKEVIEEKEGGW